MQNSSPYELKKSLLLHGFKRFKLFLVLISLANFQLFFLYQLLFKKNESNRYFNKFFSTRG